LTLQISTWSKKKRPVFEIGSPTVEPGKTKSPTVDFPFW
jgi:hypothetical protein